MSESEREAPIDNDPWYAPLEPASWLAEQVRLLDREEGFLD